MGWRVRRSLVVGLCMVVSRVGAAPVARETPDQALAAVAGTSQQDSAWQAAADEVLSFAGLGAEWTTRARSLSRAEPLVAALPDGSLYASETVLAALREQPDGLAFLAASLAATAGRLPAGETPQEAIIQLGYLSDEVILQADRTAMLWLCRAGIPPLAAARAFETLERAGLDQLFYVPAGTGPSLTVRKERAQLAAVDLIKAGAEFDFAVIDLVEQRYEEALVRFETFLQILPDNDAAWNNVGLCHYRLAIADLSTPPYLLADAIAQYDTSWMKRSIIEPHRAHWDAARRAYEKALALNPRRIEALSNYGNLLVVDRQFAEAQGFYERALALNVRFAPALNNLGVVTVYLAEGPCPESAEALFRRAAAADAGLAEAQYNLGQAYQERQSGDPGMAFDRYLALAPRGAKARAVNEWLTQHRAGTRPVEAPVRLAAAETALSLWNRVQLELETSRPSLLAMVDSPPDQSRRVPGLAREVVGWNRQGLVVELSADQVSRVLCGRPAQHGARTRKGVQVGQARTALLEEYGPPTAVSKQSPYDVWLYPATGLGFFLVGDRVSTIFLFEVDRPE